MSTVCPSSTKHLLLCYCKLFQLKHRGFSLQTAKPVGLLIFSYFCLCAGCFLFSTEVAPLLTLAGDVSLTLSPIYQSGFMAHFSQVPQTRNSLWLLHSFSTNCVKKQQNPASGNMFPFLVLFCIVTISVTVSITYRQASAANSDQKFMDVCIPRACLPHFFVPQLYKYRRDKLQLCL